MKTKDLPVYQALKLKHYIIPNKKKTNKQMESDHFTFAVLISNRVLGVLATNQSVYVMELC